MKFTEEKFCNDQFLMVNDEWLIVND